MIYTKQPTESADQPGADLCQSWHRLPQSWALDNVQALTRLRVVLDGLSNASLIGFMDRLLADSDVARPFLSARASYKHHHAREGGLLVHSVECAEFVRFTTLRQPYAVYESDMAVVAALLHDIGKIKIHDPVQTGCHIGVDYEALNLEVIAPYIRHLDSDWPEGGWALRQILAPYNGGKGFAPLLITDVVRYVDRLSAGADLRREHFRHMPGYQQYVRTEHGQLLARLKAPPEAQYSAVSDVAIEGVV